MTQYFNVCKHLVAKFPEVFTFSNKFIILCSTESLLSKFSFNYMPKQGIFTDGPNDWIGKIWLKYAPKIYKQCSKQTNSNEAAKDLFQDVALKFCRSAKNLDLGSSLGNWFRQVVRTTYCDRVRRICTETPMSNLKDLAAEYHAIPSYACTFFYENERKERAHDLVNLFLKELSPAERVVVEGTYIAGVTLSSMSRDFGMPRCVLWKRRNAALKKLRNGRSCRLLDLENPDVPEPIFDNSLHRSP